SLSTFHFLLSYVFLDPLLPYLCAVYVALRVNRDTLGAARPGERAFVDVRIVVRDERRDFAVARAPDTDAALPFAVLARRVRFGIGDVNHVVLVDIDAARPAELAPFV